MVKLDGLTKGKNDEIGTKIAMHIAASNPLSIDKDGIEKEIVDKELEIIKEEIKNSGKPSEMVEKKYLKVNYQNSLNDNSFAKSNLDNGSKKKGLGYS